MSKINTLIPIIKDTINDNRTFVLHINGTSMMPFLKNGDYVYLKKPDIIKKNDIILYQRQTSEIVIHRVIKVKNNTYTLMGDHQIIKEYPIYSNQVIAKVYKVKRNKKEYSLNKISYHIYLMFLKFKLVRKLFIRYSNETYK